MRSLRRCAAGRPSTKQGSTFIWRSTCRQACCLSCRSRKLSTSIGRAAVAEGIEKAADLQALTVMGCDFGQGVLIAPPMPQQQFLDLLSQRANGARSQISEAAPAA